MVRCRVISCRSDSEQKNGSVSFHAFPDDPDLRQKWIIATGRKDWIPTKYCKICSNHFPQKSLIKKSKKTVLYPDAIPVVDSSYSLLASLLQKEQKAAKCCAVPMCANKTGGHRFPTQDKSRLKQWLEAIRRDKYTPTKHSIVCKSHFTADDYQLPKDSVLEKPRPVLKKCAVPSQFPWNERNCSLDQKKMERYKRRMGRNERKICVQVHINNERKKKDDTYVMETTNFSEVKKMTEPDHGSEVIQGVCRGCLVELNKKTGVCHIFETWSTLEGIDSVIAEDLAKIANIQISRTDKLSKVICKICYKKLQEACIFVSDVRKNDFILQQRLAKTLDFSKEWPQPIQVDKNINGSVFENAMQVEIKQEVMSDVEFDANGDDDYKEPDLSNLDIKIEPEELLEQQPIKIMVNGTISYDQFNVVGSTNNVITNGDNNEMEDEIKVNVKQEPLSENEEQEPMEVPLECMLCTKTFSQVSGLKAHVIAHHSYKTVKRKDEDDGAESTQRKHNKYVCVICRRSFSTSTDLMVHETCHNKHVCYGCNEKFASFRQLTAHGKVCTAVLNKTVKKPKTLDDVIRPQYSPKLQCMDDIKKEAEETSLPNTEPPSDDMDVQLDVHSMKSEPLSEDSNMVSEHDIQEKISENVC